MKSIIKFVKTSLENNRVTKLNQDGDTRYISVEGLGNIHLRHGVLDSITIEFVPEVADIVWVNTINFVDREIEDWYRKTEANLIK